MVDIAEYQVARSTVIDAFARFEAAVIEYSRSMPNSASCPTAPLGQKLNALRKIEVGPNRLSKKRKAKLESLIDDAVALLPLRAAIVHSQQRIIDLNGPTALYCNVAELAEDGCIARLLTLGQHAALSNKLASLTDCFPV